jgi:hypothetical protein
VHVAPEERRDLCELPCEIGLARLDVAERSELRQLARESRATRLEGFEVVAVRHRRADECR